MRKRILTRAPMIIANPSRIPTATFLILRLNLNKQIDKRESISIKMKIINENQSQLQPGTGRTRNLLICLFASRKYAYFALSGS